MNLIGKLVTGSVLSLIISSYGLAADTAPAATPQVKTAAAESSHAAAPAAPAAAAPAAAPAIPAPAAATEQGVKIGYVDMIKIAQESKSGKAATESIKAKSEKLRAKIQARQKQLEKQKAAIEAKIDTMSAKERAAKGKEFQKRVEEYQKLVRFSEEEMAKMQEKLTADLYQSIKKTAASYAKSHGYAAILEEKAILYMSDTIQPKEVTDEIAAAVDAAKAGKKAK